MVGIASSQLTLPVLSQIQEHGGSDTDRGLLKLHNTYLGSGPYIVKSVNRVVALVTPVQLSD